jgi:lysyl-tRNA synthetase class 2
MWQPTTTQRALIARAKLLKDLRHFFETRQVLEVETPLLAPCAGTDIHLQPFQVSDGKRRFGFLQTSPEFAMKRLLAAGSGSIYQISKAFRQEESGPFHNPEFTMLEWYRVGWTHFQLIEEIADILSLILKTEGILQLSFAECFHQYCDLDPFATHAESTLKNWLVRHQFFDEQQLLEFSLDTVWDAIFSLHIQPKLGHQQPVAVIDYPAASAALAKINPHDPNTAARFEIFVQGIELANGYHELVCAEMQQARFEADNRLRKQRGLPEMPIDNALIAALETGMPESAGVALGLDRLLMLQLKATHIEQVIAFTLK